MKLNILYDGYLFWSETLNAVRQKNMEFLEGISEDIAKAVSLSGITFHGPDGTIVHAYGETKKPGDTYFSGNELFGSYKLPVVDDSGRGDGSYAIATFSVLDLQETIGGFFTSALPGPWSYLVDLSESPHQKFGEHYALLGDIVLKTPSRKEFIIALGMPLMIRTLVLTVSCVFLLVGASLFAKKYSKLGRLETLSSVLETRDAYTAHHSSGTADFACAIACSMGLSLLERSRLRTAAVNHDIGKIFAPDAVLLKPGPLNEAEFAIMREHPADGERIVSPVLGWEIGKIIRHHHEKWNGTGYPDGLYGKNIPLLSRIMSVADVYDALTTDRPYRKAMGHEQARSIILDGAGRDFDPDVVSAAEEVWEGHIFSCSSHDTEDICINTSLSSSS